MYIAYLDEVGEAGEFISLNNPKYRTSPCFGYAGWFVRARPSRPARRILKGWTKRLDCFVL